MVIHVKNAAELHRFGLNKKGSKAIRITEKVAPRAKKEKFPWPKCDQCGNKTSANNVPQYQDGGKKVLCILCWAKELA